MPNLMGCGGDPEPIMLPLATIDLVSDNREFEVFRHILSCYTHYSWLIV